MVGDFVKKIKTHNHQKMAGGTRPKVTVELGYLSYLFIFVPLRKNSQGVAVHLLLGAKSWWEL